MCSRRWALVAGLGMGIGLSSAAAIRAGGFEVTAQGARAAGMADAFAAQADDPTAVYYNPAGLAFVTKKVSLGLAPSVLQRSQFQGLTPGIAGGTAGEQDSFYSLPAHAYAVKPLAGGKLGLGAYSPFQLETRWAEPDTFSGRALSVASRIRTYDLTSALGWQLGPHFGIGAGAIYRVADLTQKRRLQIADPQRDNLLVDVASIAVKTDTKGAFGWNAGLLAKAGHLSLGLSYRSPITLDLPGAGRLTQVPSGNSQLDSAIPLLFPLDRDLPLSTRLQLPDSATLGLAFAPSENLAFEVDVERGGWSRFEGLALDSTTDLLDDQLQGPWEDSMSYRLGVRIGPPKGPQWRFGYALEETPQPDESVSPFFPDGAKSVVAAGFGLDWLNLAFQWQTSADRTTFTAPRSFNGTYRGDAYRLLLTVTK